MRASLIIAAHLLRRLVRRPGVVLLLTAIPLTLVLIEYAAFGGGVATGKLPPVKILVLDEDATFASRAVPQAFSNSAVRDMFVTATVADRETARRAFERGEAAALVVVPGGFQDALLDGRGANILLYKNPLQTIGPEMAQGVLDIAVTIGNRLYAEASAPIERIRALQQARRDPTGNDVAEISRGLFEAGRRLNRASLLGQANVAVQRPNRPADTGTGSRRPEEFFARFYPGLVIFAMLFLSQALALGLLRDRLRGLERRIGMAPVSWVALASGGLLYLGSGLLVMMGLLAALGVALFGLSLRDPLALLSIAFGIAAFATSLQLIIITVARSDRGAGFMGTALLLILMLLGGTFVPAENFPAWLRVVSFRVPNGAAQQAFIDVLADGQGLAAVAPRLATTWTWAILTLGAYVYLKRRSVLR